MLALFQTFTFFALSALALAIPTPTKPSDLFKRTISGAVGADCGQTAFTEAEVEAAASAAASLAAKGSQIGKNKYPHQFNNREGFEFLPNCSPPFFEFPIFKSKVYTGGSPGPDRVVFGSLSGSDSAFCGLITHTGASGNGFLQCEATQATI
ncbi:Ribonuclease/ribotoxin [Rhizoctonia solani]|nr:Ribonuclease/ribotoxin [Rhizoctonia solani]